ncbi:MAG TPA: hypothetical protein VN908_07260 [Gemmatimonadales bacterium]|nr:hypothetical protein [Gemmatimonadales bacterium]
MRRMFAMFGLVVGVTTSALAQRVWQSEIGIQGGFVRVKPAGTGLADQIDVFAIPGANYVLGLLSEGSVYAIIPWFDKLAIEPSFVVSQLQANTSNTTGRLGLRANYAITSKLYASAGAVLLYIDATSQHVKQLGLQGAVGYRLHLAGSLNGRVEANFSTTKKVKDLNPFIGYGVLFGVSSPLNGAGAAAPQPTAPERAWHAVLGVQGGYLSAHTVGGGQDIAGFAVPGLGGSLSGIGPANFIPGPPTMFVILPISNKIAIETGFDIVRVQQAQSSSTGFSGNFSARVNYAVRGSWYGAAGANLNYLKYTSGSGTITGANIAWGYRFGLGSNWGGRVELNYSLFGKKDNSGTGLSVAPQNVVGLLFGAAVPL